MDASELEDYLEMKFDFMKTSFGRMKDKQVFVFEIFPPPWNVCNIKRQYLFFKSVNPAATRWQWRDKYSRLTCRLRKLRKLIDGPQPLGKSVCFSIAMLVILPLLAKCVT